MLKNHFKQMELLQVILFTEATDLNPTADKIRSYLWL